jgi:hypothetical protein
MGLVRRFAPPFLPNQPSLSRPHATAFGPFPRPKGKPRTISYRYRPEPPRRKRVRRRSLTKIDQRGRLGKRIAELTALFTGATGGDPSPILKMRIAQAAELTALAEQARGDHMRGGGTTDIVRLERAAASAVRALGNLEAKP